MEIVDDGGCLVEMMEFFIILGIMGMGGFLATGTVLKGLGIL